MDAPRIFSVLKSLKVIQLQRLLTSIGANTGGNKRTLTERLEVELQSTLRGRNTTAERGARILSIDMGIKNLAFCVCDTRPKQTVKEDKASSPGTSPSLVLQVQAWRHVSLIDPSKLALKSDRDDDYYRHGQNLDDPTPVDSTISLQPSPSTDRMEHENELSHPAYMSRVARTLVADTILPYKPDVILIERQRFRSGSSAQVQEWTLRVNMLEAMLWACLRCLSPDASIESRVPEVYAVSPKRVGSFWFREEAPEEVLETGKREALVEISASVGKKMKTKTAKAKIEKKEKVNFVRRWISTSLYGGSKDSRLPPKLIFSEGTEQMGQMFAISKPKRKTLPEPANDEAIPGIVRPPKMDDLADCLLQAAAWTKWQQNKRLIANSGVSDANSVDDLIKNLP